MDHLLEVHDLSVTYGTDSPPLLQRLGLGSRSHRALEHVDLVLDSGEALGIVGESASSKSTLMRAIMGLTPPSSGSIEFRGTPLPLRRPRSGRRAIQMVFQDPGTTLNPARTIGATLAEVLRVHRMVARGSERARVEELLQQVSLPASVADAYPRRLSGGQKQRVAIARCLALEPEILIADEATSALDVVVQAAVLDLLLELRRSTGISLLCVSHDLDLVRYLCDRAMVLKDGQVVESAPVEQLFASPQHPYTRSLLESVPRLAEL